MFDELLKLPGVQNAQGALLWFLTIAGVLLAVAGHINTLVSGQRNARKERNAEKDGAAQAKTNQFESISAAEARFREATLGELERLRERFAALEKRYEDLREQYDVLEGQNTKLQRQYDRLLAETGKQTEVLERIERNTESG